MDDTFHLGEDGIYRCQAFQRFIWQSHGFGTRHHNPAASVTLRQVHSDIVVNAHGLKDRDQDGDALVTNDLDLSIGVRSADCVPILLLDTEQRAVGAVHAGWRGTAAQVVKRAIHKMASDFGSKPGDILAAIGPCVRACCYDVGREVQEQFEEIFPEWAQGCAETGRQAKPGLGGGEWAANEGGRYSGGADYGFVFVYVLPD